MEIKREFSYGKARFNDRIHIIINDGFSHGPLCRVDEKPLDMPGKTIKDVDCAKCKKTVTYRRIILGLE